MKKIFNVPEGIYHIKGSNGGPNVFVLGGTHGDEIIGVGVVKKILADFGLSNKESGGTYESDRIQGNFFVGFGNPKAIEKGTRVVEEGFDLNRSFQINELEAEPKENDHYSLNRARALFTLFRETDLLIDLHSTHAKSVPFVCVGNSTPYHEDVYASVPVEYVLIDPDNVLPKDVGKDKLGTTDYAVNKFGGSKWSEKKYGKKKGIAFAYESGSKYDVGKIDAVRDTVYQIMQKIGSLNGNKVQSQGIKYDKKIYKLADIIKARYDGGFEFEKGLKEGWVDVKRGATIGTYFQNGEKELMPQEGKLLFQKEKTNVEKGESLCYVAVLA